MCVVVAFVFIYIIAKAVLTVFTKQFELLIVHWL